MTRLPEDALLDQRFIQAAATPEDADRLLDVLLPFYEQAKNPAVDQWGEPDALWPAVRENLETLSDKPPAEWSEMLARLRSSQFQFLALHDSLLEARVQAGKVVEGHGDLRPEHICLLEPPIVYDCVEFSLPFRAADVLSELAFLAMECDFLGAGWFGQRILSEYRRRSGDDYPDILAAFYKSYRGIVRGKVEYLRSRQQSGAPSARHLQRAYRYLQLASSYAAEFHEPRLLVMIGASGTGKSTVAKKLADALGAVVLRTDAIRQELAGGRDPDAKLGSGLYSADRTERTYEELFRRARKLLREGVTVVLDGTFIEEARRAAARSVAAEESVRCLFLFCDCPEAVAIGRIEARRLAASDISDARPDIYKHQIRILKQAADLSEPDVLHLDTTTSDGAISQSVIGKLKAMGQRTV
jgi:predicted kinase